MLVDYRDADATFDGLVQLASDEPLRSLIVANGRNDASRFSISPDLNTLDFLYEIPTGHQSIAGPPLGYYKK